MVCDWPDWVSSLLGAAVDGSGVSQSGCGFLRGPRPAGRQLISVWAELVCAATPRPGGPALAEVQEVVLV